VKATESVTFSVLNVYNFLLDLGVLLLLSVCDLIVDVLCKSTT
jgi:hypothetical protein